jgi:HSP20 family molecular chaperone IbpA
MYNDFFDLVWKSWERPIKEVKAFRVLETHDGYQIVCNALGIDKEDIKVQLLNNSLHIEGETSDDEIEYTNKVKYQFNVSRIANDIEKIDYTLRNGLLIVNIITLKTKKKEIKVAYKD